MKIKGITFFEQHVEKLVVGLFAVVVLGVLGMQFLTRPNEVTMDGQPVAPGDIEPRLKTKADSIASRLAESANGPPLVEGEIPLALDDFRRALADGVSPNSSIAANAPSLAVAILPSDVASTDARFYVPTFEAPTMLPVFQEADTLADTAIEQYPELAERFPNAAAPKDVIWNVVPAKVDLARIRSELHRANPSANPPTLAIPTLWFNDSLYIVDVVFERQEARPDGTWSDPVQVAALPGQLSFRPHVATADAGLRDEMFRLLSQRDSALEILQPEFLPTKGGSFTPASVLGARTQGGETGDSDEVRRLKRQLTLKKTDLERRQKELTAAGGPLEPEKPEDKRDRKRDDKDGEDGGGGGRAPGGGFGFGSGAAGDSKNHGGGPAKDEATKAKRINLTKKVRALEADVSRLEGQLQKLAPDAKVAAADSGLIDLSKDVSAVVWGHDIDVSPGRTYRYRCALDIYNPFFARKSQLVSDQQKLADPFVLRTAESGWGEPITVEPAITIFVTDAAANEGRLGLGQAKVEVYRFYDGARRLETFVVQPGDRIGGLASRRGEPSLDFTTDWYLVDVVEDLSSDRSDRQHSGLAVLRRAGESELETRLPYEEMNSDLRLRFNDDVEAARAVASSSSGS